MHPHAREQHRAVHRTRDDAAARHHRLDGRAAAVGLVVHELGWRQLHLVGRDGPARVVEVEQRVGGGQVDVGVPVRVDRAHVAPVGLFVVARAHGAQLERVRGCLAVLDGARNDVLAEVVGGVRVVDVVLELPVEVARVEDVDAHARERTGRVPWHRRRVGRLLDELGDEVVRVDCHHAESAGLRARHGDAADRAVTPLGHVVGEHQRVVHLVNVVAGEHHDVVGTVAREDVLVLIDGIGRAAIPARVVGALLGRQKIDELVHLAFEEAPATLHMAQQAVRLVLRDHADAADTRVQAVRQCEVDNAELAAEIHRRLGAAVGQALEPAAPPAGQYQRDGAFGQVETRSQFIGCHSEISLRDGLQYA